MASVIFLGNHSCRVFDRILEAMVSEARADSMGRVALEVALVDSGVQTLEDLVALEVKALGVLVDSGVWVLEAPVALEDLVDLMVLDLGALVGSGVQVTGAPMDLEDLVDLEVQAARV